MFSFDRQWYPDLFNERLPTASLEVSPPIDPRVPLYSTQPCRTSTNDSIKRGILRPRRHHRRVSLDLANFHTARRFVSTHHAIIISMHLQSISRTCWSGPLASVKYRLAELSYLASNYLRITPGVHATISTEINNQWQNELLEAGR